MRELAVDLVGDGALLQHHHHVVRPLGEWRHVQIDEPVARISRGAEVHFVFVDRSTAFTHLIHQSEQRAAERHKITQQIASQQRH